jgi:hypothetical protein
MTSGGKRLWENGLLFFSAENRCPQHKDVDSTTQTKVGSEDAETLWLIASWEC